MICRSVVPDGDGILRPTESDLKIVVQREKVVTILHEEAVQNKEMVPSVN